MASTSPSQNPKSRSHSLKEGHEVIFAKEPTKEIQLECSICLQILSDPCILDCSCGYSFCQKCIEMLTMRGSKCPLCVTVFTKFVPNIRLGKFLREILTHCPHNDQGCAWINELRYLTEHLNADPTEENRLEGCPHTSIKCLRCLQCFKRKEIDLHETKQCVERQYTCEYCNEYTSTFKEVYTNHWPVCKYFMRTCEKGGKWLMYTDSEAPSITNTKTLLDYSGDQDPILKVIAQGKMADKIYLPTRKESVEVDPCQRDTLITQPVTIVMTNYSKFRSPEGIWYSKPFYTHEQGYCMCVSVQPNSGTSNRCLSVATHIMEGEFDNELIWPLRGEVAIKLVSQTSEKSHCRTIEYTREVGAQHSARLRSGDRSAGLGKDNFIARRSLTPNFLENDSLRFCVQCNLEI